MSTESTLSGLITFSPSLHKPSTNSSSTTVNRYSKLPPRQSELFQQQLDAASAPESIESSSYSASAAPLPAIPFVKLDSSQQLAESGRHYKLSARNKTHDKVSNRQKHKR